MASSPQVRPSKRRRLFESASGSNTPTFSQPSPAIPEAITLANTASASSSSYEGLPLSDTAQYELFNGIVCFGTIPSLRGRCERHSSSLAVFPINLESSERFSSAGNSRVRGLILPQYGQLVQGLLDEKTLILHATCSTESDPTTRRPRQYSQVTCTVEITVYGPLELCDDIGEWFQEYSVYLQDPRECHLDVKYCNPQRLSSDNPELCPYVSEVVQGPPGQLHFQDITEQPDLLDIISGQDDLEEIEPPESIQAILHKHQKQALSFMLRREKGWAFDSRGADVWEAYDSTHDRVYINRITDAYQRDAPPHFCGGIIADPMGLGKTLTMIALAATDSENPQNVEDPWDEIDETLPPVDATLIIVPQPLLSTWEEQISGHVREGALKARRHHGKTRLNGITDIDSVNVVLTTYHTLSADWRSWNQTGEHIIFSVRWRRIILDEAHLIRNMKTRMARALCDLHGNSRWAVTGTPIQNHLSDLAALLKFIRAHPYDDPKQFDNDLSHLWKAGEDEEAVKRLKRLSRCLILRRAKRAINLPSRRDVKCPVNFSKEERELYESIRHQTITRIEDALLHDTDVSRSGIYINFLQQIESMRLICNLGLHYHARHDVVSSQEVTNWAVEAQDTFNIQREMYIITCSQCSSTLEMTESLFDYHPVQESPQFSRCFKYACAECCHRLRLTGHHMVCGHTPRCPVAPVSVSNSAFEDIFGQADERKKKPIHSIALPSKVEALVGDLKTLPSDVKSIVFSTWRLTLDIVEAGLNQAGIRSVRFDGKLPQTQRQPVLNQFKRDPSVRVLLITLQCGAVGLTLTEASRAYLMEPHWNPTIEEQALARIHRIGQTRQVTTVRFYIRDSFEDKVMETQETKKNLAGVLLSGHDGEHADDSLGALQRLRSLL